MNHVLVLNTHLKGPSPNLWRQSASPGDSGSGRAAVLLVASDIPDGDADKRGRPAARLHPEPDGCDRGLGGMGEVGEGPGIEALALGVSLVGDGGAADLWRLGFGGETIVAATAPPLGGLLTLYLSSTVRLGLRWRFVDPCKRGEGEKGRE